MRVCVMFQQLAHSQYTAMQKKSNGRQSREQRTPPSVTKAADAGKRRSSPNVTVAYQEAAIRYGSREAQSPQQPRSPLPGSGGARISSLSAVSYLRQIVCCESFR